MKNINPVNISKNVGIYVIERRTINDKIKSKVKLLHLLVVFNVWYISKITNECSNVIRQIKYSNACALKFNLI